jgi:two-component system, sensor histidine kinase LadS
MRRFLTSLIVLIGAGLVACFAPFAQGQNQVQPQSQNQTSTPALPLNKQLGQPQNMAGSTAAGHSVPIIELYGRSKSLLLAGRSEFWIDPKGTASVSDLEMQVRAPTAEPVFRPSKEGAQYFLHNKALWMRFDAKITDASAPWFIDVGLSTVDAVSLHWRDKQNNWVSQYAGDAVLRSEWPYPVRTPLFKLSTASNEVVTYYLRIGHQRVSFAAPITLYQENASVSMRETTQLLLGAYSGWMLIVALSACIFALIFKDRNFVYCALYIGTLWISQATYTGLAGQYFWPESTYWINYAPFFLAAMTMAAGLGFVRSTLKPWLYSQLLSLISAGLVISQIAIAIMDVVHPTIVGFQLTMANSMLSLLLIYAVIYAAWQRGDQYARWLALGFLPVVLGVIPQFLRNLDLMATSLITQYSVTLGAAIAAPMTLYALFLRSSARRESVARSAGMPLNDPLTGLANMRALLSQLHGAITRARRYKNQYALVLIELSNHPWFFQEHGQEVADRSLVLLADAISRIARDVDVAARLENNQFLLLVEGPCSPASVSKIAARIAASALKPSEALPVGASLKLRQTVALMPDAAAQIMGDDANDHLGWMLTAAESLEADPRQTIRTLNF